ncbi:hypothetical protein Q1695_002983 [Nippostrongylus brasiliensis]|nr:hypothetical protein Q1695_002983 [Nippostrongylus brasiliensis]
MPIFGQMTTTRRLPEGPFHHHEFPLISRIVVFRHLRIYLRPQSHVIPFRNAAASTPQKKCGLTTLMWLIDVSLTSFHNTYCAQNHKGWTGY